MSQEFWNPFAVLPAKNFSDGGMIPNSTPRNHFLNLVLLLLFGQNIGRGKTIHRDFRSRA